MSYYDIGVKIRVLLFRSPLNSKLKSDHNQTCVKDAIGVPSNVSKVEGHVELFYVSYYDIGVQVVTVQ